MVNATPEWQLHQEADTKYIPKPSTSSVSSRNPVMRSIRDNFDEKHASPISKKPVESLVCYSTMNDFQKARNSLAPKLVLQSKKNVQTQASSPPDSFMEKCTATATSQPPLTCSIISQSQVVRESRSKVNDFRIKASSSLPEQSFIPEQQCGKEFASNANSDSRMRPQAFTSIATTSRLRKNQQKKEERVQEVVKLRYLKSFNKAKLDSQTAQQLSIQNLEKQMIMHRFNHSQFDPRLMED